MPLPSPRNHIIALDAAGEMTAAYRAKFPGGIQAGLFPIEVFHSLSRQQGCAAIRIYFGLTKQGELTPILAGVDAEMNDQLPDTSARDGGEEGNHLYEFSFPCPVFCGDGNALNGG